MNGVVLDSMTEKRKDKDDGYGQTYRAGWSRNLILAGVATTVGSSVPVGFNIGVVNTPQELIKQFCNESVISHYGTELSQRGLETLWSVIVSVFIVGGCAGSMLGAALANTLGRKGGTITTNVLSLIGAVLFVFCRAANSVEMLFAGRLIVGLAAGLTTSIVPMYLTELSPAHLTGAMGVVCPMGVNFGVLIGQVLGLKFILGSFATWHYLLSVFGLLVAASLPVLLILPESPKYLYAVARDEDKGLKALSSARGVHSSLLGGEVAQLRREASGDEEGAATSFSVLDLFSRRYLLPTLLACSMQAGQQTSGINSVFFYSTTIFKAAQLSDSAAEYATIGCGFINCCTAVLMVYLLPRAGRRPLLLGSTAAAALLLALLATSSQFLNVSGVPYICMTAVLAYVFVYGFGLGPIPYFIASELFEVGPRPAGMALGSLANWAGNFLVGMTFPILRDTIQFYSFLIFSAVTSALFAFLWMYFPETKGRSPAEVAALVSNGLGSRPRRA